MFNKQLTRQTVLVKGQKVDDFFDVGIFQQNIKMTFNNVDIRHHSQA
jgi:hypothetical protein